MRCGVKSDAETIQGALAYDTAAKGNAEDDASKRNHAVPHSRQVAIYDGIAVIDVPRAPFKIDHTAVVAEFSSDFKATISVVRIFMVNEADFCNRLTHL